MLFLIEQKEPNILWLRCFAGLQLSSQLLSDLKRASTINKTYRMRYSATEEELLQSLSNAHIVPAKGNLPSISLLRAERLAKDFRQSYMSVHYMEGVKSR